MTCFCLHSCRAENCAAPCGAARRRRYQPCRQPHHATVSAKCCFGWQRPRLLGRKALSCRQALLQRVAAALSLLRFPHILLLCRSFQLLGLQALGFSHGFERLHYLLESAWDGQQLSQKFKKASRGVLKHCASWLAAALPAGVGLGRPAAEPEVQEGKEGVHVPFFAR